MYGGGDEIRIAQAVFILAFPNVLMFKLARLN